jgi:hypothetical protein
MDAIEDANIEIEEIELDIPIDIPSSEADEFENDFSDFTDISETEEANETLSDDSIDVIEDTSIEDTSIENAVIDNIEIDMDEELKQINDEGVLPVSNPPENISYLEDYDVSDDSADTEIWTDENIDLSDVVIDEPDLSADDILSSDNDVLTEPSFAIEDELDPDLIIEDTIIDDTVLDSLDELEIDDTEPSEEIDLKDAEDEPIDELEEIEDLDNLTTPDDLDDVLEDAAIETNDTFEEAEEAFDDNLELEELEDLEDISEPLIIETEPQDSPASPPPQTVIVQQTSDQQQKGKERYSIPLELKSELRNILGYMDQLLESLPEEKIEEFAKSSYFDSYRKLFKDLGLV